MSLQQFRDIIGCDELTAHSFLERSNSNLETALELYFEQQATSGFTPAPVGNVSQKEAIIAVPALKPRVEYGRPFSGVFFSHAHAPLHKQEESVIPFKGLAVEAKIVGITADVLMRHVFVNTEAVPIEAVYPALMLYY